MHIERSSAQNFKLLVICNVNKIISQIDIKVQMCKMMLAKRMCCQDSFVIITIVTMIITRKTNKEISTTMLIFIRYGCEPKIWRLELAVKEGDQ